MARQKKQPPRFSGLALDGSRKVTIKRDIIGKLMEFENPKTKETVLGEIVKIRSGLVLDVRVEDNVFRVHFNVMRDCFMPLSRVLFASGWNVASITGFYHAD